MADDWKLEKLTLKNSGEILLVWLLLAVLKQNITDVKICETQNYNPLACSEVHQTMLCTAAATISDDGEIEKFLQWHKTDSATSC